MLSHESPVLLVVHLSDIHFHFNGQNPIDARATEIARAVMGAQADRPFSCLLLVSGDLAYSGAESEYKAAWEFLQRIITELKSRAVGEVHVVTIPGNHDCKLIPTSSVRETIIEKISISGQVNPEFIATCTHVQQAYFDFRHQNLNEDLASDADRLFKAYQFDFEGHRVTVNAYNSSWISQIPEKPGHLFLPIESLDVPQDQSGLVISMIHHPLGWFSPNNARELRRHFQETADILLTGHEHMPDHNLIVSRKGTELRHLEGAVLQETGDPETSGFNLIEVRFDSGEHRIMSFGWEFGWYKQNYQSEWFETRLRSLRQKSDFQFRQEHEDWLDRGDFQFVSSRQSFTLSDLFMYPDLRIHSLREHLKQIDPSLGRRNPTKVRSESVLEHLMERKLAVIYGPEKSGKTAMCKRLQFDLRQQGLVPLYLDLERMGELKMGKVGSVLERAFVAQYEQPYEEFMQLAPERRVFIVDNFQSSQVADPARNLLLGRLKDLATMTIVLSSNEFVLDQVAIRTDLPHLADFEILEMYPFGKLMRSRLVQRWHQGYNRLLADPKAIMAKCFQVEDYINKFIDARLITPYPIAVLIILQQVEASFKHDIRDASYSNFCELYIKDVLLKISTLTEIETSTLNLILEAIADEMFQRKQIHVSQLAFNRVVAEYAQRKMLKVDGVALFRALNVSGLLRVSEDGIEFFYPYQFHYFVASSLVSKVTGEGIALGEVVKPLIAEIHLEQNASIIVMLGHLSKHPNLIKYVLEHTRGLMATQTPCDFDESTKFVSRLTDAIPKLVFNHRDPLSNRKVLMELGEAREQGDHDNRADFETLTSASSESYDGSVDEMNHAVQTVVELNKIFKTVDVLGQMLRSYGGAIDGEVKVKVVQECYDVTMRGLGRMFGLVEDSLDGIVSHVRSVLEERKFGSAVLESEQLEERSRTFVFNFSTVFAHTFLTRLTGAVGAQKLELVYEALAQKAPLSYRLIDLSIRMNALDQVEVNTIRRLNKDTERNLMAGTLLRRLVMTHFHLFHVETRRIQQVCSELGIEYKAAQLTDLIGADDKRNSPTRGLKK